MHYELCIMNYYYSFHLLDGVGGVEDGTGEGYAVDAGRDDGGDVGGGDASYGYDGDVDVLSLHSGDDVAVAFKPEDRGESLLRGGETERTATDVIG